MVGRFAGDARSGLTPAPMTPLTGCKWTDWDECLRAYGNLYRFIEFPGTCSIPREYACLLPWDDDFGAVPPNSVPIHHTGAILTPTTASGDNTVVSLTLAAGYDAIITGFFWGYSGTGFVQGSGDILWRMKQGFRFVKDLSNVPFALGTGQLPIPMTDGQLLYAGQTMSLVVNVPNLSGMIQIGASRIIGGLIGFMWPR